MHHISMIMHAYKNTTFFKGAFYVEEKCKIILIEMQTEIYRL